MHLSKSIYIRYLEPPRNLVLKNTIRIVRVGYTPYMLHVFLPIALQRILGFIRIVEIDKSIFCINHLCVSIELSRCGLGKTLK